MVANDLRLRESELTLGELFANAGYRTGYSGVAEAWRSVRTPQYRTEASPWVLCNLTNDPYEMTIPVNQRQASAIQAEMEKAASGLDAEDR